jgi:uncharacterized protein (TIGR03067 family)
MTRTLLGAAALLCLLTLQSRAAEMTDKDRLQGNWVSTAVEFNGMKIEVPKGDEIVFGFTGDKLSIKAKDKTTPGTFKIDEKKKELDVTTPKDNDPKMMETMQGLYKLEGDTLKIAFSNKGPGGNRPKGFDDKEAFVMTFKKK